MTSNVKNYPLLESVDNLEETNHHSMLLYDNPQYGNLVKNRFIENGLKKGEIVICFTHEDVNLLEKEMASTGIDVDYFKQKNYLHLFHMEDLMRKDHSIKSGFNDLLKKLTADSKPPYRFVGRAIPNVTTNDGIEAELILEKLFHSNFENYQCSFLCPYPVEDIEKSKRPLWLQQLLDVHHNLLYATNPEKAVSFEADLLNEGY